MSTRKSDAVRFLEKVTGGPATLGGFLAAVRQGEELGQPEFAKRLGISKLPLDLPVTVQLRSGTGECWSAEYDRPTRNSATTFRAHAD